MTHYSGESLGIFWISCCVILHVFWFLNLFHFLPSRSSSKFYGAMAKELSKCKKVFQMCELFALCTVPQKELFKRPSLLKAKRTVCIVL